LFVEVKKKGRKKNRAPDEYKIFFSFINFLPSFVHCSMSSVSYLIHTEQRVKKVDALTKVGKDKKKNTKLHLMRFQNINKL